jgi:Na+/melibiose symporter-like transporter
MIPGSILAAFAITSLVEDFTTNVVDKIAIHSVKFFATLGLLPLISIIIRVVQQVSSGDNGVNAALQDNITTRYLITIGIGLIGLMLLIFTLRRDNSEKASSDTGISHE